MYKLLTISLLLYAANVNNAEAQTDNIAQTKKTIARSQSQITRQKAEEVAMLVMAPYIYDNNTTTMAVQCSRQDLQAAIDEQQWWRNDYHPPGRAFHGWTFGDEKRS